jgi:hypothetical protein
MAWIAASLGLSRVTAGVLPVAEGAALLAEQVRLRQHNRSHTITSTVLYAVDLRLARAGSCPTKCQAHFSSTGGLQCINLDF